MYLIPTIQLQNGQCVTLYRGRVEEPSIWHVDPVAKAQEFSAAGAEWLHVTDLDRVTGDGNNDALVESIIQSSGTSVQLAGGFATMDHVARWIDKGAGRIVIGSAAVKNPDFLKEAAKYYPDQIVLAVDVYQGRVTIDAWRQTTAFEPQAFIDEFAGAPLAALLLTDVHSDIGDVEGSLAVITALADKARTPVIASGMVNSADDIARLKYLRTVSSALIGRALYEKAIGLEEAIALATTDASEEIAEFV